MSEPMSSVEIEDVLSSIRRLVSQDHRAAPKALPRTDDKLLLTPALRVVPSSMAPARPRSTLPRLHLGVETSQDEVVAPFPRPAAAGEAEFESETGDPAPLVAQMEWTEEGWVLARDTAPQPSTELEVAPWDQEAPEEEAGFATQPLPEPEPLAAETAQAAADQAWANQAEAEVKARLDAEAAKPAAQASDETELYFDEEALRGLVRDILREELQGAMGERITRSVRKLVHAEIARMVAAQSLD